MQKPLYTDDGDRPDFAYWRTADATTVYRQGIKLSVSTRNVHEMEASLRRFGRDIAIQVLHECMDIIPDTTTSEKDRRT